MVIFDEENISLFLKISQKKQYCFDANFTEELIFILCLICFETKPLFSFRNKVTKEFIIIYIDYRKNSIFFIKEIIPFFRVVQVRLKIKL